MGGVAAAPRQKQTHVPWRRQPLKAHRLMKFSHLKLLQAVTSTDNAKAHRRPASEAPHSAAELPANALPPSLLAAHLRGDPGTQLTS